MSLRLPEHLDLIAAAPTGIQKLGGLILELAVRGKLVPQDPSDEPASELLKRIAKERARLEAKGTCKKSKATPLVGEDEQPFTLPEGWEWVRLATIGNIFNGNSINSDVKESKFRRKDGLPYIATKDVGYGLTPLDYGNGVRIPESEPNFKMARKGAVFICAEGGSAGKKCGLTDRNVFFGNKLFANEAFAGIPPRVVLYLYLSPFFREQFAAAMTGIIGGVSIAKFVEIPIPLPPLAEQHRIVAKVDELMALCDRLEAEQGDAGAAHARLVATLLGTLTQSADAAELAANWQHLVEHFDTLFTTESSLDALKQTILQLAVMGKLVPQDPNDEPASELLKRIAKERARLEAEGICKKSKPMPPISLDDLPFELPHRWAWARFPEVGHFGRGKSRHRPRNDPSLFNPGIYPLVQTGEVARADTTVREFHSKYSEVGLRQSKMWPRGTLCITIAANIADSAILGFDACFPDSVVGLVPSQLIGDARYFLWFMKTARQELLRFAPATAQKNINLEILESVRIPLPPKEEMSRIVAKVDELMSLCGRLKTDVAESRRQQERLSTTLIEAALQAA